MAVIFYTSAHFIWGVALTEHSSVCNFDGTIKCLSNDSQIIATYAEVLIYTVKFNILEKNILKFMIPDIFVQCIYNENHTSGL